MILSPALESDPSVHTAMERHLGRVRSEYPNEIVGVFLVGSQNYGLATEQSDVDTRALVLPAFEQIALNREPVSKELSFGNSGKCVVRDVRMAFREFIKSNPNSLEILATPYFILNEKYAEVMRSVMEQADRIARMHPVCFIRSVIGMIHANYRTICAARLKETSADDLRLGKHLASMERLCELLTRYLCGEPFPLCLRSNMPETICLLKQNGISADRAFVQASHLLREAQELERQFDPSDYIVNECSFLHDALINLLRLSISSDPTYKEAPHE